MTKPKYKYKVLVKDIYDTYTLGTYPTEKSAIKDVEKQVSSDLEEGSFYGDDDTVLSNYDGSTVIRIKKITARSKVKKVIK